MKQVMLLLWYWNTKGWTIYNGSKEHEKVKNFCVKKWSYDLLLTTENISEWRELIQLLKAKRTPISDAS